jgi:hypothetical protein
VANLYLTGLFETTQGSGVEYAVEFLVPNGESSSLANSILQLNSPHAKTAFLKVTDPGAGTAGTLLFRNCRVSMGYQFYGGATVPLFSSNGTINYLGDIIASGAANVNLSALTKFHGNLYVDAKGSLPAHTLKGFAIYDEDSFTLSVLDTGFTLSDNSDPTKVAAFECSGIPTGTTRTYSYPNGNGTLLLQTGGITSNRLIRGHDGTTVKNSNAATISDTDDIAAVSSIAFTAQAVTGAGALTLSKNVHTLSNSSGSTYAVTLAAPSSTQYGVMKTIEMIAGDGTNTVTLSLANCDGGTAATTCTWNAAGQKLVLVGGATKWTIFKQQGVTLT